MCPWERTPQGLLRIGHGRTAGKVASQARPAGAVIADASLQDHRVNVCCSSRVRVRLPKLRHTESNSKI